MPEIIQLAPSINGQFVEELSQTLDLDTWKDFEPKPGYWYKGLPNEWYHKSPGLSRSTLYWMDRSPEHFLHHVMHPDEPTDAMIKGDAFHIAALEPDLFWERFAVRPEDQSGRTKDGKAFKAEAEEAGKIVLSYKDGQDVWGMADKIRANKKYKWLLEQCEIEFSGYWIDPETEALCKMRTDMICTKTYPWIIIDLKSCVDARPDKFKRVAYDKGYHWQLGHYLYGASIIEKVDFTDFIFAAVEKEPPYGTWLHQDDDEASMYIEGLYQVRQALRQWKECQDAALWPGYPETIEHLGLPGYIKRTQKIHDTVGQEFVSVE